MSKKARIMQNDKVKIKVVKHPVEAFSQISVNMSILLQPHQTYTDSFIDDTTVFSKTWVDHLKHLDKVLGSFEEAGMTVKLKKMPIRKNKSKFLGTRCTGLQKVAEFRQSRRHMSYARTSD